VPWQQARLQVEIRRRPRRPRPRLLAIEDCAQIRRKYVAAARSDKPLELRECCAIQLSIAIRELLGGRGRPRPRRGDCRDADLINETLTSSPRGDSAKDRLPRRPPSLGVHTAEYSPLRPPTDVSRQLWGCADARRISNPHGSFGANRRSMAALDWHSDGNGRLLVRCCGCFPGCAPSPKWARRQAEIRPQP